jgi:hypothetical protein
VIHVVRLDVAPNVAGPEETIVEGGHAQVEILRLERALDTNGPDVARPEVEKTKHGSSVCRS